MCTLASALDTDGVLPSVHYHDTANSDLNEEIQSDSPAFVRDMYSLQSIPVPGVDYEFRPIPIKLPNFREQDDERGARGEKQTAGDSDDEKPGKERRGYSYKEPQQDEERPTEESRGDTAMSDDDEDYDKSDRRRAEPHTSEQQPLPRKAIFDSREQQYRAPHAGDPYRNYPSYPPRLPPPSELKSRLQSQFPAASNLNRPQQPSPFFGRPQERRESQQTSSTRTNEPQSKPAMEFHFDIPNDRFHSDLANGRFSTFQEVPSSLDTLVSSDVSFLNKMVADPPIPDNLTREGSDKSYNSGGGRDTFNQPQAQTFNPSSQPPRYSPEPYQDHRGRDRPQSYDGRPGSYEDSRFQSPSSYSGRKDYPYRAAASVVNSKLSKEGEKTSRTKRASKTSQLLDREARVLKIFRALAVAGNPESTLLVDSRISLDKDKNPYKIIVKTTPVYDSKSKQGLRVASCAENSTVPQFCTTASSYPKKAITQALKVDTEFVKNLLALTTAERTYPKLGKINGICPSFTRTLKPLKARDVLGEWRVIVNTDGLEQEIILDMCSSQGSQCSGKPPRMCTQSYGVRKLGVYDANTRRLSSGDFRVPTGCTCGNTLF
ncbi:unnamed protein product [Ixodes hexagonus]